MIIRDATPADIPELAAIYDHYIENSIALFMDELIGEQVLRDKLANLRAPDRILVAEVDGAVVGYAASGAFSSAPPLQAVDRGPG